MDLICYNAAMQLEAPNIRARHQLRAWLQAAALALFPLHWFFQFLFYTDVLSLVAMLASHLVSLGAPAANFNGMCNSVGSREHDCITSARTPALLSLGMGEGSLNEATVLVKSESECGIRCKDCIQSQWPGAGFRRMQACLHRRYCLAAGCAAASTLMRQTNAVWAAFTLGVRPIIPAGAATAASHSSFLAHSTWHRLATHWALYACMSFCVFPVPAPPPPPPGGEGEGNLNAKWAGVGVMLQRWMCRWQCCRSAVWMCCMGIAAY